MCPVKPSTFAERLAYARWLYHGSAREALSQADIARAVKRTAGWVTKWTESDVPPRDYEVHRPLADMLRVSEAWLIRGEGDPPDPGLWATWIERRRQSPVLLDPDLDRGLTEAEEERALAAGRNSKARRKRPRKGDAGESA